MTKHWFATSTEVFLLILIGTWTAAADEPVDSARVCVSEPDDALRLLCYDRAMGRQPAAAATRQAAGSSAPSQLSAEDRFGLSDEQARKKENVEQVPELERLVSTVTKVARRSQGELVVTLANGQVWAQKQTQTFHVDVGETVTIKGAALGSFMMSTASGRSTRVTRVL